MASFTPRGFQEDESFWAVGLHLGLMMLFALPFAFLVDYFAELAQAKDQLQAMFGMVLGIGVGNRLVGWARWKLHLSSDAPTEPPARQKLYWVLPIAFPVAIGVDRLLTAWDPGRVAAALGLFLGVTLGDAVFHGLRSLRTAEEDKP